MAVAADTSYSRFTEWSGECPGVLPPSLAAGGVADGYSDERACAVFEVTAPVSGAGALLQSAMDRNRRSSDYVSRAGLWRK